MINQHINKIPLTYFGKRSLGAIKEIKEEKIAIIYSRSLEKNEIMEKIKDSLECKETLFIIPEKNSLAEIENMAKRINCEVLIAIGGGNIIDFSKLLRLKIENPDLDISSVNQSTSLKQDLKLITIPSTPSTGSQVTPIAITHNEKGEKMIVVNNGLIPNEVILSPHLLSSLNKNQMAEFICDIFAHSAESYISRMTNSFIQNLAEMNLKKLNENWKLYKEDGNDLSVLDSLAINGQIGGICQGNAYTGVMHALAHQLEILKKVGHSKALLNIIKPVLEWYKKETNEEIYDTLINLFNELDLEKYKEDIFKDVNKSELIKGALLDPSIKTSPIIFNEEKLNNLIKWMLTKK